MWLMEGPFDGKIAGDLTQRKSKLLKCGSSYVLSRKRKQPTYLVINSPKVSGEHAIFVVGEHNTADVSDTNVIPTLTLITKHKKPVFVHRGETKQPIETNQQMELQSGDVLSLVQSITFSVRWKPVFCFMPQSTPSFSFEKCAALGIKLFAAQNPATTHYLTPTLNISSSIVCSVLRQAQIVHPDWLAEYLRLGDSEKTDHDAMEEEGGSPLTMLEFEFLPPSETKHPPSFAPTLPSALKVSKVWEPNQERENMFKGWRVLFVGEKGREADQDLLQMLDAGGAEYEVFDVTGGEKKWKQVLGKNKRKASKGLSVVADEETMQVAAEAEWNAIKGVLKESDLRVIKRSKLLEAVLYIDTSRMDSAQAVGGAEDSLSNTSPVANTHSEVPSNTLPTAEQDSGAQAGPSRRPLRRRGTAASSRASTPPVVPLATSESSNATEEPEMRPSTNNQQAGGEAPQTRKQLTRRSRTAAVTNGTLDRALVGVDDPSILDSQPPTIDSTPSSAMPPPNELAAGTSTLDSSTAAASGRPGRLKRRRNADDAMINPVLAELERDIQQVSQIPPPLKKFKALFDETDPDRLETQSGAVLSNIDFDDETAMGPTQTNVAETQFVSQTQTQTQSETMESRSARKLPKRLAAVAEEVEESQPGAVPSSSIAVVPLPSADVEMDDGPVEEPPPNQAANTAKPTSSTNGRPLGTFSSTQQQASSKSGKAASGAAPGKPDTDNVFLKAIASTKKGKKGEDDFDREFNKLRISKPEVDKDAEAKQWEVLADFGDDGDLRGNFMVIVEMDVPERQSRSASTTGADRPEWQGKANYKRFKKKHVERYKNPVELVVDDENDYGMGAAYWKTGSQSQEQSQSQGDGLSYLQPSQTQNKGSSAKPPSKSKGKAPDKATQSKRGRSRSVLDVGSGSEDEAPTRARKTTRAAGKSQPLFLPDDDDEEPATLEEEPSGEMFDLDIGDLSLEEDEDSPPPTKAKGRVGKAVREPPTTSKRKRTAALMDDDADTAFKGFGARKKTRM